MLELSQSHTTNVLLKTKISSWVTKNAIVDENCCVNISIMSVHLVCKLQQTKYSFLFVNVMDEWICKGQCPVCDTSLIFSNQLKNRYPRLFAYFQSCAQTKSFSQLWFIFDVLSSLAAITEACQNRAKVILLMTLEMDHPDVCRRLARKTE